MFKLIILGLLTAVIGYPFLYGQNQKATTVASTTGTAIPAGVVMPYAGATAPAGWVFAYGQEVSQTSATYKALYAAISTTYCVAGHGAGACSGGNFRIPDMRGRSASGKDDMGGSAASRITTAKTINGTVLGNMGGDQNIAGHYHAMAGGSTLAVAIDHDHPATGGSVSGSTGGESANHSHNVDAHSHPMGLDIAYAQSLPAGPQGYAIPGVQSTGNAAPATGAQIGGHSHGFGTIAVSTDLANFTGSKTPTGLIGLGSGSGGCDGNSSACNNLNPTVILNYIIKL
jgi:microcystin-dependent protein